MSQATVKRAVARHATPMATYANTMRANRPKRRLERPKDKATPTPTRSHRATTIPAIPGFTPYTWWRS